MLFNNDNDDKSNAQKDNIKKIKRYKKVKRKDSM